MTKDFSKSDIHKLDGLNLKAYWVLNYLTTPQKDRFLSSEIARFLIEEVGVDTSRQAIEYALGKNKGDCNKNKQGYKLMLAGKNKIFKKILQKHVKKDITLDFDILHPEIKRVSKSLFDDGHYSQAIFEAYKAVVNEVKNVSGIKNLDGKPLMEQAFSLNNPVIKFNILQSQSDKDEQIGLMFLFSGAALGIRNPKAHDYVVQKDPLRTLEYLSFASLLLKRLDERIK